MDEGMAGGAIGLKPCCDQGVVVSQEAEHIVQVGQVRPQARPNDPFPRPPPGLQCDEGGAVLCPNGVDHPREANPQAVERNVAVDAASQVLVVLAILAGLLGVLVASSNSDPVIDVEACGGQSGRLRRSRCDAAAGTD